MPMAMGRSREALVPAQWPAPPVDLSVSSLRELEACPRRWALGAAEYTEIWDRPGYPPKLQNAALEGTVVHLALATVTKRLSAAGCSTVGDPAAIEVMKRLGGYTALAVECIERVLQRYGGNPRTESVLELARNKLKSATPEIRTRIQSQLSRLQLRHAETSTDSGKGTAGPHRLPLGIGSHTEVTLRDQDLAWFGIADLITLSERHCEIRDFKTGQRSEEHSFQLRVYALLWFRDGQRNPSGRSATKLVLAYGNGDVLVDAPGEAELESLARELARRGRAAKASVAVSPPEVRPSQETCRYCSVRHLCKEYWTLSTQRLLESQTDGHHEFGDIQVVLESRHGPTSWDARLEIAKSIPEGRHLLLRTKLDDPSFALGDRLRILDVHIAQPEADDVGREDPFVATMGDPSEVFVVRA